jgi:ferredoxin
MEFRLRNLILANLAVLATSFLAFLQNPATGYIVVGLVVLTDLVLAIRLLSRRRAARPVPGYRVEIDRQRCVGQANCRALAPDTFALDGERKAVVRDLSAAPRPILDAARACPVDAIFLYDAAGRQVYPDPTRPWQKKRIRQAS